MFGLETGSFFSKSDGKDLSNVIVSSGVCDPLYPPGTYMFYQTLGATVLCVLGAATAAGLT